MRTERERKRQAETASIRVSGRFGRMKGRRRLVDRPPVEGERMRAPPPKTAPEVMRARKDLVTRLRAFGLTLPMLREAIRDQTVPAPGDDEREAAKKLLLAEQIGAPLSEAQVAYAWDAAEREATERFEKDRGSARAFQAERLARDLVSLRQATRTTDRAGNSKVNTVVYREIAKHEELLGRVFGTFAPEHLKIDVNATVRRSLIAVVMGLGPREQERLVAEQRAIEGGGAHHPGRTAEGNAEFMGEGDSG